MDTLKISPGFNLSVNAVTSTLQRRKHSRFGEIEFRRTMAEGMIKAWQQIVVSIRRTIGRCRRVQRGNA
jgi:hypothetical protein